MRIVIIILLFISTQANADIISLQYNDSLGNKQLLSIDIDSIKIYSDENILQNDDTVIVKYKRFKAVILTLLTGPLGGHRIYLGTQPVVPVLYSLTLGGGILITVIDLFHLIFVRDISRFENNNKFFMWVED